MKQIFSLTDAINILKEIKLCARDIDAISFNIGDCSEQDARLVNMNLQKIHKLLTDVDLDDIEILQEAKVISIKELNGYLEEQDKVEKERQSKVLNMDYVNWLVEFVKKEKSFNTEANNVGFNKTWSELDKENVLLIDTLFDLILAYYWDTGLPIEQKDAKFFNQTVSVNLTLNLSVAFTLWQGQGSLVEVSIIPNTDMVLIEDVILHFKLE